MMEIRVTGYGGREEWLHLPASQEELEQAGQMLRGWAKIQPVPGALPQQSSQEQRNHIAEIRSPVRALNEYLKDRELSESDLEILQFIAIREGVMDEQKREVFDVAIRTEPVTGLYEIANFICNLDKWMIYPARDERELGEYLVIKKGETIPEEIRQLLDYEQLGRQYADLHCGAFSQQGYVFRAKTFEPIYEAGLDPEYEKKSPLIAYPGIGGNCERLYLPAPESYVNRVKKNFDSAALDKPCRIQIYDNRDSGSAGLAAHLPLSKSIMEMNQFAKAWMTAWDGTKKQKTLFFAALEAELPSSMGEVMEILERLQEYEIVMGPENEQSAAAYARKRINECEGFHVDDLTANYVDYQALGTAMMKLDGAARTDYGMVIRRGEKITPLPETLAQMRLYSPLAADMYYYTRDGVEEKPFPLEQDDLSEFEKPIRKALEQEELCQEKGRGLAEYLNNRLLARKISSMRPTIEKTDDGKLWGVLEIRAYGRLTADELELLKEEWTGQCSDGFGESFEQREISTEQGFLLVSFYTDRKDYVVFTEQEMQENTETHELQSDRHPCM